MIARPRRRPIETTAAEFLQRTLDSLLCHMAILRADGTIVAVNAAWRRFAVGNGLEADFCGPGANYLRACDRATGDCSEEANRVADGIRAVAAGDAADFTLEYPCHSPTERRWFCVRVTRFEADGQVRLVVTHDNITQRKLAEIELHEANRRLEVQAATDGLTGVANRRAFDATFRDEWRRNERTRTPLAVALFDVDCFKLYNDRHGHPAGDECLKGVAAAIRRQLRRPGDFAARYGGEEFAVVLPNTDGPGAAGVLQAAVEAVRTLGIPHPTSKVRRGVVTVSVGVAVAIPCRTGTQAELLERADRALYEAKEGGRDRLVVAGQTAG